MRVSGLVLPHFNQWLSLTKIKTVIKLLVSSKLSGRHYEIIRKVFHFLSNPILWSDYTVKWTVSIISVSSGAYVSIYKISQYNCVIFLTLKYFFRGTREPAIGPLSRSRDPFSDDLCYFSVGGRLFEFISLENWEKYSSPYLLRLGATPEVVNLLKNFYVRDLGVCRFSKDSNSNRLK